MDKILLKFKTTWRPGRNLAENLIPTEVSIMERLTTRVKDTALVAVYYQTALTTKESGKMVNEMVLEVLFTQMETNTLDFG